MTCAVLKTLSTRALSLISCYMHMRMMQTKASIHIGTPASLGFFTLMSGTMQIALNHKKWIFCGYAGSGWIAVPLGGSNHGVSIASDSWTRETQMHLDLLTPQKFYGPSTSFLLSCMGIPPNSWINQLHGIQMRTTRTGPTTTLQCKQNLINSQLALMIFLRFVDRDMFMRFLGGGIGHRSKYQPQSKAAEVDDDTAPITEGTEFSPPKDVPVDDDASSDGEGSEAADENEEIEWDEEDDYGYHLENEEDDDEE